MKKIQIVINPNKIKTRCFESSEIGRGIGIHRAIKGKGSYNRKLKHKQQDNSNDGYSAVLFY